MQELRWRPSEKQELALNTLNDKVTNEILYGGGAGGGKSYLGCVWIIFSCLQYPGTRYLIGRAVLKSLKESTLLTFFEVCKQFGLEIGKHYKYNAMEGVIKFYNGSDVYLKDLATYPSDPEFDRLGSTEYTYGFIDEASQVSSKAFNIVKSRLRYKLDEYGLIPKILVATNPSKNFTYYEFYKPSKNNTLPKHRAFIPALVQDNPYISKHYVENLKKLDKVSKQRLLYGNWEYDDDPAKLMDYDSITDIFTNTFVKEGEKYITADLAMQGRDNFIIVVWNGMRCKIVGVDSYTGNIVKNLIKAKSSGKEIEEDLKKVAEQFKVSRSHIAPDSGGMGSYLESYMEGIKPFDGAHSAYDVEYRNLRSECYFKLAELVNKKEIYIDCDDPVIKESIIEELEQIKRDNVDKDDVKKKIVSKEIIKEMLGRSPDFADVLMMRMVFLVGMGKSETLTGGEDIFG